MPPNTALPTLNLLNSDGLMKAVECDGEINCFNHADCSK